MKGKIKNIHLFSLPSYFPFGNGVMLMTLNSHLTTHREGGNVVLQICLLHSCALVLAITSAL